MAVDFKTYYLGLDTEQRQAFAEKVGTSTGYCHQLAYGSKHVELGLADAIVAAAGGSITLDELPLTQRAKHQREVRGWDGKTERRSATRSPATNNKRA
jgi:hypothetical protein